MISKRSRNRSMALLAGVVVLISALASALELQVQHQAMADDDGEATAPVVPNQAGNVATALFEAIETDLLNDLKNIGVAVVIPELITCPSTFDYKVSLNLGIAVADALSSAVNRDKAAFLLRARLVHDYAQRLGVEEQVLRTYAELRQAVTSEQWRQVEALIYALKDNISVELHSSEMADYAVLAMVSGWLEGLHIVAASLQQSFPPAANELLRDADFVRYLREKVQGMSAELRDRPEVQAILVALPQIDSLINRQHGHAFSPADAAAVLRLTTRLRQTLML